MPRSKISFLSFCAFFVATATMATAQTRNWGFSKDTVYSCTYASEKCTWPVNTDSVTLVNQGTDTLRFDSMAMELPTPGKNRVEVMFSASQQWHVLYYNGETYYWGEPGFDTLQTTSVPPAPGRPGTLKVDSGTGLRFRHFRIDRMLYYPAIGTMVAGTDTISARLIFIAANGRGRDTLMVKGIEMYNPSTSILRPLGALPGVRAGNFFDALGRRVDPVPADVRVPVTPVVSPKE